MSEAHSTKYLNKRIVPKSTKQSPGARGDILTALTLAVTTVSNNCPTVLLLSWTRFSRNGHQLNFGLNLIVGKEFAPVCWRFTHKPPRRQPRRPAHTRAALSAVRPVRPQQVARHASLDRRSIQHDRLRTNHHLPTQEEHS